MTEGGAEASPRKSARLPLLSRRGLAFRLLAILFGLSPFIAFETVLWIVDWGRPEDHGDPFVGFRAVTPLFVPSDDGTRYEIARGRQVYFCPDSFPARKPPGELRIFCLGGSTVFGRPFELDTSFTTWLELSLQTAAPDRRFDVVNCGGVSYASYRLVPILAEVLGHSPDLIILYTGHNEFLEDRTYGHIKRMPEIVAWPLRQCARLRSFTLLRSVYLRLTGTSEAEPAATRPLLPGEVDARLDHAGGLDQYHRDEEWRQAVIDHFRYNVSRMVAMCRNAGVPIILVNPVCNVRDSPPFKSQHRDDLRPEERKRWEALRSQATKLYGVDMARAIGLLRAAMAIDDQHAGLHFELGRCLESMAQFERAREAYERAKELDVCPLRILEEMNRSVIDIARQTDAPLVDVREIFVNLSDHGIPGNDWLVDHVHPSIEGHKVIAVALARALIDLELLEPAPSWDDRREERFRRHYASLDDFYFFKGTQRLEGLRRWAAGRAGSEDPDDGK